LLGLTHHEAHFARYQQGDFYQKHVDAFVGRSSRVLTTVCYLNDVASGGALQIYTETDAPLCQVQPKAGTMVLFESARFPHEVLPADTVRYSIAGWFRID
jgi:SM-20-related protein